MVIFTKLLSVNKSYKLTGNDHLDYHQSLISSSPVDTVWVPISGETKGDAPSIQGESALFVNANTGDILYEKNSREVLRIASLTKIMTALVALEHAKLDSLYTITKDSASVGENSMGLTTGEVYSLEELLYGLLLNSGNDAAYALAENVAGGSANFTQWMNIKALELGLTHTTFYDPSGLDDRTTSTVYDMVRLTRYALQNKTFSQIVSTPSHDLEGSDFHKYVPLINQTNLLTSYPGVLGVKTGYTEEAGLCLVTYAKNEGVEVIGVVLNSTDRKGDMILMLDYGFANSGVIVTHNLLE